MSKKTIMTKNGAIKRVRNIYADHLICSNAIKSIHSGFYVLKNTIDSLLIGCALEKMSLHETKQFNSFETYGVIIEEKKSLNQMFQIIYNLSIQETVVDHSVFLRAIPTKDKTNLGALYKDFEEATNRFTASLKKLYVEILAIPESDFRSKVLLTA